MENLHYYYAVVEEALLKLGTNPVSVRGEKVGQWNVTKGSASVWIDVWHSTTDFKAYFQVLSPVIDLPKPLGSEFLEEVLDKNNYMLGTYFCFLNSKLYIKVNRECLGMDSDEAKILIERTSHYADKYDDYFSEKYLGIKL